MKNTNIVTGDTSGVIRHSKLPLVILRTDYLVIAQGNYCAAKLLAVLENWTNWFVRQGKPERWVRLSTEAIHKHLLGEHKKVAIQKAIALLVGLGFIRQEQRRKHRHDRSWFYWFDIEKVQNAIDALELPGEPETEEDYLQINAKLEPETRVVIDTLSTANQQLLKVTNETLSTANRDAVNSQSICHSTTNRDAVNSQSLNRHLNKEKIAASNISAAAFEKLSAKEPIANTTSQVEATGEEVNTEEDANDGIDYATDELVYSPKLPDNPEANEIVIALRDAELLNPELKAEALKYPLADVQAALRLYQQRSQQKPIDNPQGWMTRCLQNRWWTESKQSAAQSQYPPELVEWYEKACAAGIVDGRDLRHCPGATTMGNIEQLQVVMLVPPEERDAYLSPFKFVLWRDAITQFPL